MSLEYEIVFPKTQTRMNDCWYACIQMLRCTIMGEKTKPQGDKTLEHRDRKVIGRKLGFGTEIGEQIINENQLFDVSGLVRFSEIKDLEDVLSRFGPVIACGKFAFFNKFGHCIVISGCNTDSGMVSIYDPGWLEGRQTKSWSYIGAHCQRKTAYPDMPRKGTFIASRDWPGASIAADFARSHSL